MRRFSVLCILLLLLSGCERTNWQSSVPDFPVRLEINTNVGMYVNFVPENICTYLIADEGGIHLNGVTQPLTVQDAYGYAGTVVYIDGVHPYGAYDLCCPHCLRKDKPCYVDGMFAICPLCGEEYDIYLGSGYPQKGISKEPLKEYRARYSANKVFVTRKQ